MKPRRPRPDEDPFENQDERFDTSDYERFFATPADEEDDDGDGGSDGPSADVASELDSDDPHREPARHADRGFRDESLEDEFTEGEFIEDESVDHTGLDDDDGDDDDAPEPTALERRRRKRQRAIETLYEDAHLHAIQKPAGLSTVDDRWDPDADTVIDVLWRAWLKTDPTAPRPHVVHRLDRDTTGVIIFARHREAQRALREQFRRRTTHKTYVALAQGCPQPAAGTIEIQIDDDMRRAGRMRQVKRGGKECVTHYQVIETFRGYSWVELRPITGRTHQIRISL
ncbi:MAG: RluA family pseudouridine synthase, partial [Planctomycetota bacterium]